MVYSGGFSVAMAAAGIALTVYLAKKRVGAENSERGRFGAVGADLGRVRQGLRAFLLHLLGAAPCP